MFMLFLGGWKKKALLLVFVLLLARTAHFETFNRVRERERERKGYTPPLLLSLAWHCATETQPRPPRVVSELGKAYLEVLRRGSCPLIPVPSQQHASLCFNVPFSATPLVGFTAAGVTDSLRRSHSETS